MAFRSILFISFFLIGSFHLFSQNENNKLYFIITKDGAEHIGNVEGETDIDVTLRLRNQEILVIPKTNIKLYEAVTEDNLLRGKYVYPNRFANRYMLGSSSIAPGRNQFIFTTSYALAYTLDYGINDVYSVGLSTTIVGVPLLLNLQANYKIGNQLYFGGTATGGWGSWADGSVFFGYGGVRLTTGSKSNNYTFGGGYFSLADHILPAPRPSNVSLGEFGYVNFSAMKRYTKKISALSELWIMKNIYLDRSIYTLILGMKVFRNEKSAWTFSVSTLAYQEFRRDEIRLFAVPNIAWSRKLGKK